MKSNTYVKKPQVFEVEQWFKNGDHSLDYGENEDRIIIVDSKKYEAEGQMIKQCRNRVETICPYCNVPIHNHGSLDGKLVHPGDYIIMEENTETREKNVYSMRPKLFEVIFEKA